MLNYFLEVKTHLQYWTHRVGGCSSQVRAELIESLQICLEIETGTEINAVSYYSIWKQQQELPYKVCYE